MYGRTYTHMCSKCFQRCAWFFYYLFVLLVFVQWQCCNYGNYTLQQQSLDMAQELTNYSTTLRHKPRQPGQTAQMQSNDTVRVCVFVLVQSHENLRFVARNLYWRWWWHWVKHVQLGHAECFASVHQHLKQQAQSMHENIRVLCTYRRQNIYVQDRATRANAHILWGWNSIARCIEWAVLSWDLVLAPKAATKCEVIAFAMDLNVRNINVGEAMPDSGKRNVVWINEQWVKEWAH